MAPKRPKRRAPPVTFGNYVNVILNATFDRATILEYVAGGEAAYGVASHFWLVCSDAAVDEDIAIEYFVDGEETPSISMQAAMASGQAFSTLNGSLGGNGTEAPYGTFAAGGKMGKGGQHGGWWHYHPVLFRTSVHIQVRLLDLSHAALLPDELGVMVNVRGHEVHKDSGAADGLTLPSGYTVPADAKLLLQRIDNVTFQPMAWAPVVRVSPGYAGLLYLTSFATSTSPAGTDYVEVWPGIVMGTGYEDYFDSSYGFCGVNFHGNGGGQQACLQAHDTMGVLHHSRVYPNGTALPPAELEKPRPWGVNTTERISAYRFFDREVAGFTDGGALKWRAGEATGKCLNPGSDSIYWNSPVAVRSYAWVYVWPLEDGTKPHPNDPPLASKLPEKVILA